MTGPSPSGPHETGSARFQANLTSFVLRSGYRSGSQLSKIVLNNTYTLRYVSYTYYFILGLGLGDFILFC